MKIRDFYNEGIATGYWGEISKGWDGIVEQLCTDIMAITEDIEIFQVREKYGGLRFYVDNSSNEISKLITDAEDEAINTCEFCGSKNEVVSSVFQGCVFTLCKNCREENRNYAVDQGPEG